MSMMAMAETQTDENLKLEIRRVIRASRQRIYAAWTRPEEFQRWFGPPNVSVLYAEANAREGGTYRITTTACQAEPGKDEAVRHSSVSGEYLNVIPNLLLRFTWRPEWNPGEESLVTVQLHEVEGGTELILKHESFPTEESRNRHEQGWTGTMVKLADYLEQ